jgi:hypothetical protein
MTDISGASDESKPYLARHGAAFTYITSPSVSIWRYHGAINHRNSTGKRCSARSGNLFLVWPESPVLVRHWLAQGVPVSSSASHHRTKYPHRASQRTSPAMEPRVMCCQDQHQLFFLPSTGPASDPGEAARPRSLGPPLLTYLLSEPSTGLTCSKMLVVVRYYTYTSLYCTVPSRPDPPHRLPRIPAPGHEIMNDCSCELYLVLSRKASRT